MSGPILNTLSSANVWVSQVDHHQGGLLFPVAVMPLLVLSPKFVLALLKLALEE